jgi:hypothetical protein
MFEIMKIPQIQENFIKTLHGKDSTSTKEINAGMKKGTTKSSPSIHDTSSKIQVAMNASLTGQR